MKSYASPWIEGLPRLRAAALFAEDNPMNKLRIALVCSLMVWLANGAASELDRVTKQKQLDQACEVAREKKLAPLRQRYIEECVEKEKRDRAYCERFYSDYGAQSGNRAPLFYDLPECVTAFEYRSGQRQGK